MHILVAPDKFKFSLDSFELCDIIADALITFGHKVTKFPLADGGDGWLDIFGHHGNFEDVWLEVHDPLFRKIQARYKYNSHTQIAVIEMAKASGITLLKEAERHCIKMSTFGTGELILRAIQKGAKEIFLGIGGSASNDAGIGMANALGYQFYDKKRKLLHPTGEHLGKITRIDTTHLKFDKTAVKFTIACDVNNPLFGKNGAAHIFARQKGASDEEIIQLDNGLRSFSQVVAQQLKIDISTIKGGGAAGGVGAGGVAFLDAVLQNGMEMLFQFRQVSNSDVAPPKTGVQLWEEQLSTIGLIIFAEGKIDEQSFMGKPLGYLHALAQKNNIPLAVICGEADLSSTIFLEKNIIFIGELLSVAQNQADSFVQSKKYVAQLITEFAENL